MNTINNSRRQETDRRIMNALLNALKPDRDPSVEEICRLSGVNRSTFYRHYLDIYDLMEKTEQEIGKGLAKIWNEGSDSDETDPLERLVGYVASYASFYRIYFRKHLNEPMKEPFLDYWDKELKPLFLKRGVADERRMMYYFQYVKAGVMTVLRQWLDDGLKEDEKEIARILHRMMALPARNRG